MDEPEIRPAIPADVPEILRLIRALAAAGERPAPLAAPVTEASVLADGFGPSAAFEVILGCRGERVVGFAQFYPTYAAWIGQRTVTIANLYVEPDERRGGLARKLVASVAKRALAAGATRLELFVEATNPARAFYTRLGFVEMTDIRCRIEAGGMMKLAEGS